MSSNSVQNNNLCDPNVCNNEVCLNGQIYQIISEDQILHEIVTTENAEENKDDEQNLNSLLERFKLQRISQILKDANVTYRSLKYLSNEDLKEIITDVPLRAEFRYKLFYWRKQEFGVDDTTISANTKVDDWLSCTLLGSDTQQTSSTSSSAPIQTIKNNKSIQELLNETSKGKALLNRYRVLQKLENNDRDELIQIILEDVIGVGAILKPCDFPAIVNEITNVFPTELNTKEYYYIPRKGKKNPAGKLYTKYSNIRCKKRKSSSDKDAIEQSFLELEKPIEVDETVGLALKAILNRDSSDWAEIEDRWEKTFNLRQNELKTLSNIQFLTEWSKFADSRAPKLIEIDFKLLYPDKTYCLFAKWEAFKLKIAKFYEINIRNERCLEIFKLAKVTSDKDTADYLLTSLLNSVLLPTARFTDRNGRNKRKATIADAQECFIVRLDCINEYKNKIAEITNKYYNIGLSIQPFIIVEGAESLLNNFYVYFDKTLYKLNSFIESLDICFKIFQILSLQYPQACVFPWNFIQQFFYNIHTKFDVNSPNLTSILSHMNDN